MKFLKMEFRRDTEGRSVTLQLLWFGFTLFFGKKTGQLVERNYFEGQMKAIRDGRRLHPAMMTVPERHEETAKVVRKLKWSKYLMDPWGTRTAFEAIRDRPRQRSSAVDLPSAGDEPSADDVFEAQGYTAEWICGRLSLTVAERVYLKLNFFKSV